MIKYFDTQEAYEADIKSKFESSVSLIGSNNEIKYDGHNVVVGIKSAKTYDIAYLDENKALRFISADTFDKNSFPSNFEVVGVVGIGVDHPEFRGKVTIIRVKTFDKGLFFLHTIKYVLSSYICDGTTRTGTLVIYTDNTPVDYTIEYNATSEEQLIEQLNAYFEATEALAKRVIAYKDSVGIIIQLLNNGNTFTTYSYGKSGFALSRNYFLDGAYIPTKSYTLLKNGTIYTGYVKAISDLPYTINELSYDTNTTDFNPISAVEYNNAFAIVCLPAYLGKSKYRDKDYCSAIRAKYGEGKSGWINYLKSRLVVYPTKSIGLTDTPMSNFKSLKEATNYLASLVYRDYETGELKPNNDVALYIQSINFNNDLLKKGEWALPSIGVLYGMLKEEKASADSRIARLNTLLASLGMPGLSTAATLSYNDINNGSLHCISTAYSGGPTGYTFYTYTLYIAWAHKKLIALVQIDVK